MKNPIFSIRGLAALCAGLFLAVALFAECSAQEPTPAPATSGGYEDIAVIPNTYLLAPADTLDITVLGYDEYKSTVTILPDGTINYLGGAIVAAGRTVGQLRHEIAIRLLKQIKKPQVSVSVQETHPRDISVLGAVNKEGLVEFQPGMHLLDAIASCQGLEKAPDLSECTLITDHETRQIAIDLTRLYLDKDTSLNAALSPGDVILITTRDPEVAMVQVIGQVKTPGQYHIPPGGGTVLDVIAQAGGSTENAALSHVQIVHDGLVKEIDLHPLLFNVDDPAGATRVVPGDIVSVPLNHNRIAVVGEVATPKILTIPDGEHWTVLTALTMAGGLTAFGDNKHVALIHTSSSGLVHMTTVSEDDFMRGKAKAADPEVQATDIIVVPKRKEKVNPLSAVQNGLGAAVGLSAISTLHL